jgi:hypothetical protein
MSLITIPFVFVPGTPISSSQVNADFAAITNVVNGNLDGTNFSTVFTSLSLSNNKGHATFPGGLIVQWGSPNSVAFDNSAASVITYDIPFVNQVFGIYTGVSENTQNAATAAAISVATNTNGISLPLTQFNLTASGGAAGKTGQIFWLATGY